MPSIADLFITVSSDVSGAITGLTDVDNKVNSTTASMQAAAPAGYALAAAATAVGAGFLSSITVASDFEAQMNGIKAVMSPEEVIIYGAAVEDLARKLGADTVFSASEAANAIEEMIKAGVPLPAILGGAAASALDLAAATGVDVTQAAQLASTAMNTYHASAEALPGIMDTISNVSNATAISVQDLQFALAAVGPVAAGIGLDFEGTATALGIFANNGLRGSDAGTSLKTMLLNLEPSTKAQIAAFKELNLFTEDGANKFFDAAGNARPLNEIFQVLKESTANLTAEQKINLLQTAFGTDAVRAATIAASEGAAGWDRVTEAMEKMGGTQVAAAQRNQGLEGSLNQLSGSFENVQITIGNLFLPALTSAVNVATGLLNAFQTLDPGIQVAIVAVVGIAGALAGLTAGIILLTPLITSVVAGFGALALVAAPILPVLVALGAAAAALYFAWQTNFGGIQEVTAEVMAAIQPGIVNVQNFIAALTAQLGPALAELTTRLQPLMAALEPLVREILQLIPPLVRAAGDAFNALGAIIQQNSGFFEVLRQVIDVNLTAIINIARLFLDTLTAILQGDFGRVLSNMVEIVKTIGGAIAQNILIWAQAFIDWVGPMLPGLINALGQVLGNLIGWITGTALPQLAAALTSADIWAGFVNAAWEVGTRIGEAIGNFIGFIAQTLGDLPNLIAGLGDFFGPFVNAAWEVGARLGEAFVNFLSFIGSALSGIPDLIAGLGDFFGPLVNAAWEVGTRLGEAFGNFLGFIGQALSGIPDLIAGLGDIWGPFVDGAWELGNRIGDAIQNVLGFIGQAIGSIPDLLAGLGDIFGAIVEAAAGLVGRIGEVIEPIRQLLIDTFGNLWEWLTGAAPAPTLPGGTEGGGTPGTIGTTGPIVSIGTLVISSPEEADAFLNLVAQAVLASAQRVTPPLVGANPALP